MAEGPGLHHRLPHITLKISSLLISLPPNPPEYDKIAPKIVFWVEYVLSEGFATVGELVEGISRVIWDGCSSYASVAWFLKEFRGAPRRSEQARSFVDRFCEHILRWFAITSVENLGWYSGSIARCGGKGFVRTAELVGYFIEYGLLSHELVRQHLVKPLIAHHYTDGNDAGGIIRANAIYKLFITAGNTLLRGLLEPEDVQVCFQIVNAKKGSDPGKLQVWCAVRSGSSHHNLTYSARNSARSTLHG